MRSMRRAAEQLLEVVLLAGVSSLSNTTVSASTARHSSLQLLGLALADEPGVVGRVAALHERAASSAPAVSIEQGELVEAGLGVVVGVPAAA